MKPCTAASARSCASGAHLIHELVVNSTVDIVVVVVVVQQLAVARCPSAARELRSTRAHSAAATRREAVAFQIIIAQLVRDLTRAQAEAAGQAEPGQLAEYGLIKGLTFAWLTICWIFSSCCLPMPPLAWFLMQVSLNASRAGGRSCSPWLL